jgi:hypothetical protein
MISKQAMYDQLFPAVYLKMVEQFLPNMQVPDVGGMLFTDPDMDRIEGLPQKARLIALIGADAHAEGLEEDDETSPL